MNETTTEETPIPTWVCLDCADRGQRTTSDDLGPRDGRWFTLAVCKRVCRAAAMWGRLVK